MADALLGDLVLRHHGNRRHPPPIRRFRGAARSGGYRHHRSQGSSSADGGVEMRVTVAGIIEIRPWIMSWGDGVEVLAPPSCANRWPAPCAQRPPATKRDTQSNRGGAQEFRPTTGRFAALGDGYLGVRPARSGAGKVDEVDRYLDTVDLRLATARWACRLRTREGRTIVSLKGPCGTCSGDALHLRGEVEGPASASSTRSTGRRHRLARCSSG